MIIKNELKHLLFKMPRGIRKNFYLIYNSIKFSKYKEEKKSYGNLNQDKIFYIIRPRPGKVEGLMALFLDVIKHLEYADKRNYIPFVDFANYETQYYEKGKNAWELFFCQVSNYSLEEIYQSKNVILSGLNVLEKSPEYINQKFDDNSLMLVRKIVRKYIKIKPEIQLLVNEELMKLGIDDCLGLYLRGTDYIKLKPAGHPVQPTTIQAIQKIDEYFLNNPNKKIFLVTEDANIYSAIIHKYGENVCTINKDVYVYDYDGKDFLSMDDSIKQLGMSSSQRGITYLIKILLLSKCKDLIGGNTSGSWAACVLANSFDYIYIFDLGRY